MLNRRLGPSGRFEIPTLSLFTLSAQTSCVNVPDGTPLYVTVNLLGSGYLITAYPMLITSGAGAITVSAYIIPGTTVQNVVITDSFGNIISIGQ